eukprot:101671_1
MSASEPMLSTEDEKAEFMICIKALDDIPLEIRANVSDTIETIKQRYRNVTGMAVEHQIYVYRGLEMNNKDTLSKYKINKYTTIHAAITRREESAREREDEFAYLQDDEDVKFNQQLALDNTNLQNDDDLNIDPALIDRPYYDFLTCCTGYCTLCCLLPLICAPDIIALNVVNSWETQYDASQQNEEWNACIWNDEYVMHLPLFLTIGSLWSIISYSLFALWFFWYLKTSSYIVMHRVRAQQLEWEGLAGIMASTRFMNNVWCFLSLGLLVFSCIGIHIHDQQMVAVNDCKYSSIGVLVLSWSAIHLVLSFVICGTLCLVSCCFMSSDNIFTNVQV